MLVHTFDRAEKLIAKERILTIVARHHLAQEEVRRQLSSRPANNVIVQPANKETGPGILLPLLHLYKRNADAVVAVFPSDHFILREENFAQAVRLAAQAVRQIPAHHSSRRQTKTRKRNTVTYWHATIRMEATASAPAAFSPSLKSPMRTWLMSW
jgi:mannose-1-phosphate guanylyltransferase